MYCLYILTIASLKMFLRNRQAVFFTLFFPLLFLLIFGFMNFDSPMKLHLGVVTQHPDGPTDQFIQQIGSMEVFRIHKGPLDTELKALKTGDRAVVLDVPDNLLSGGGGDPKTLTAYTNASEQTAAQAVLSILDQCADKMSLAAAHARPLMNIQTRSISVHEMRYIEFLLPGVIAMAVMQMSVFSVAHVFVVYKEKGILKRLMATPMRPIQFVSANIITRLLIALVQTFLFIWLGMRIFHTHVTGAYWLLTVCVILGAVMFLGLGFSISAMAKTTESVPVIGNLVIMPMLFLGNVFFSASSMPAWVASWAKYLPLTFFANSLRSVMTESAGASSIARDLVGMTLWGIALVGLATMTFRFQDPQGA
jgi:ABC-2 type transport system permease protein